MKKAIFFKISFMFLAAAVILTLSACGAREFSRTITEFEPYDEEEIEQTKSGITVKKKDIDEFPQLFVHKVQECDKETGKLLVDSNGDPVMEERPILPENAFFYELQITNNMDHVVRLNSSIFALFDPADNRYDSQTKDELCSALQAERPCPNTSRLCNQLGRVKMLTHNTKLLPKRTENLYLIFLPKDTDIPGIWQLALYEIPVKVDDSGNPTETVNFEIRSEAKRYKVKYLQESPFSEPQKVQKEELTN